MSHAAGPGNGPVPDWRVKLSARIHNMRARLKLPVFPSKSTERFIYALCLITVLSVSGTAVAILLALSARNDAHNTTNSARGAVQAQQGALSTANSRLTQAGISPVPTPSTSYTPLPGPTGPSGPVGTGERGQSGLPGLPGATGAQGVQGATGVNGQSGQPGANGQVGPAGPAGAAGLQGPQGSPGSQGDPGDSGQPGSPPKSFSFTIGIITYTCTPDGDSGPGDQPSYTCTPDGS